MQAPLATYGGEPAGASGRFALTHTLILLIVFLGLGCTLFLAGTACAATVLADPPVPG